MVYGYNCRLELDEKVRVVAYSKVCEDTGIRYSTPDHLIGIEGVIRDIWNGAYESSYPTGYERVTVTVEPINKSMPS
jgi:hypothetical protein